MKLRHLVTSNSSTEHGTLIARFGRAALIQNRKGVCIVKGGSHSDRLEAQEWISLFMHELVIEDR